MFFLLADERVRFCPANVLIPRKICTFTPMLIDVPHWQVECRAVTPKHNTNSVAHSYPRGTFMPGITRVTGKVKVRVLYLILCYSLLLSSLPTAWHGGSSRSQSATPQQGGIRTQGPPSPNAPNIDAIRAKGVRKQEDVTLPAPTRAKHFRHWEKRCQQLKEKKAQNRSTPANSLKGLLAFNHHAYERYFDWHVNHQADLVPELNFLFRPSPRDVADSFADNETDTDDPKPQHPPRAFAALLVFDGRHASHEFRNRARRAALSHGTRGRGFLFRQLPLEPAHRQPAWMRRSRPEPDAGVQLAGLDQGGQHASV
jgi:hypothetical protein